MTPADQLIELKEIYGLSTVDLCDIFAYEGEPIQERTMGKWLDDKVPPPRNVVSGIPQVHENIAWLASFLQAHPELDNFAHAHFKAAINSLDTKETL